MKQIINTAVLPRALNAQHHEVHYKILEFFTAEFAATHGIEAVHTTYADLFAIETAIYRPSLAYELTSEITAADAERDSRFLYISYTITGAQYSANETIVAAGKKLTPHLNLFKESYRMEYSANTSEMREFVRRLRLPENAEAVATLNLGQAIDDLEGSNNQFSALFTTRTEEYLARISSETMTSIRPKVDEAARATFSAINAIYQVNELITKDAEKKAALEPIIDSINGLLAWLKKTLDGSSAGNNDNAPSDEPTDGGDNNGEGDDPTPPPYEPEEDEPVVQ